MGHMQAPWLEPSQLQQDTLLHIETGHAQARHCLEALQAIVGAQLAVARDGLALAAAATPAPAGGFNPPADGLSQLSASQALYARAVSDAGAELARQSAALAKAYWNEQQRRMKALFGA